MNVIGRACLMSNIWLVLLIGAIHVSIVVGNPLDLQRPEMGWVSWNKYGCNRDCANYPDTCIGDTLVRRTGEDLVKYGLRDVGYQTLILDDCWHYKGRTRKTKRLVVDRKQFPKGVLSVSRHLQSRNLTLGLLFKNNGGDKRAATADAYMAKQFELGLVKLYTENYNTLPLYASELKSNSARPMYTTCAIWNMKNDFYNKPGNVQWDKVSNFCNAWSVADVAIHNWKGTMTLISQYIEKQDIIREKSGPGHWLAQLTLEITSKDLNNRERRTQMAMWCMFSSPLIFSADISEIDEETLSLMVNRRLISIDQDLSRPAKFIRRESGTQLWSRKLKGVNRYAIAILNESEKEVKLDVSLKTFLYEMQNTSSTRFRLIDVYTGNEERKDLQIDSSISIVVDRHDTEVYFVEY